MNFLDRLKRRFGATASRGKRLFENTAASEDEPHAGDRPDIPLLPAEESPWGVHLFDVRPVTQTMLSTSTDPQCAINLTSFGQEDGTVFIGQKPPTARRIAAELTYATDDRPPGDGALFIPRQMEDKWAIFYHRQSLICVRSWLRQVTLVAKAEALPGRLVIRQIDGCFIDEQEPPELTVRLLDFLLRTHALNLAYPVPLPDYLAQAPYPAALWCFSMFGNRALCATPHDFPRQLPEHPMRTHTLLHIAVARGDKAAIRKHLETIPVDALAGDGLPPLHWALASGDQSILALLLDHGSPVDIRSAEGATPLMTAIQGQAFDHAAFLLERGAAPNAQDLRGFTALHRAAEMGFDYAVNMLLQHGACPNLSAEGHTPSSLAMSRGHEKIMAMLASPRS